MTVTDSPLVRSDTQQCSKMVNLAFCSKHWQIWSCLQLWMKELCNKALYLLFWPQRDLLFRQSKKTIVDPPVPGLSQPLSDSLHFYGWEDVPLRKDLGYGRKLYSGARGPGSHDMEVPTRGATCRCASVSEGFLHRNCVLSLPSWPPLTVVLSKSIGVLVIAGNVNLLILISSSVRLFPARTAAILRNTKLDSAAVGGQSFSFPSWTSSDELTDWKNKAKWFLLSLSLPLSGHVKVSFLLADRLKSSLPWCALAQCCSL